ncbi:hypothetical protein J8273_6054 [Carpediemonas membranifera]|uniref:Uncharacterized protein n=1 Tax=Carpediemonas membranifera TaxID=201153 RepID=A0A8J6BWM5_9EUKA|nr:hypothetical protein J8273_6054 [Carpediemonas membranifera]|eukprot:KAG9392586.1 hypothetical protein J8273_6054 [Carpediemonas membranifera]
MDYATDVDRIFLPNMEFDMAVPHPIGIELLLSLPHKVLHKLFQRYIDRADLLFGELQQSFDFELRLSFFFINRDMLYFLSKGGYTVPGEAITKLMELNWRVFLSNGGPLRVTHVDNHTKATRTPYPKFDSKGVNEVTIRQPMPDPFIAVAAPYTGLTRLTVDWTMWDPADMPHAPLDLSKLPFYIEEVVLNGLEYTVSSEFICPSLRVLSIGTKTMFIPSSRPNKKVDASRAPILIAPSLHTLSVKSMHSAVDFFIHCIDYAPDSLLKVLELAGMRDTGYTINLNRVPDSVESLSLTDLNIALTATKIFKNLKKFKLTRVELCAIPERPIQLTRGTGWIDDKNVASLQMPHLESLTLVQGGAMTINALVGSEFIYQHPLKHLTVCMDRLQSGSKDADIEAGLLPRSLTRLSVTYCSVVVREETVLPNIHTAWLKAVLIKDKSSPKSTGCLVLPRANALVLSKIPPSSLKHVRYPSAIPTVARVEDRTTLLSASVVRCSSPQLQYTPHAFENLAHLNMMAEFPMASGTTQTVFPRLTSLVVGPRACSSFFPPDKGGRFAAKAPILDSIQVEGTGAMQDSVIDVSSLPQSLSRLEVETANLSGGTVTLPRVFAARVTECFVDWASVVPCLPALSNMTISLPEWTSRDNGNYHDVSEAFSGLPLSCLDIRAVEGSWPLLPLTYLPRTLKWLLCRDITLVAGVQFKDLTTLNLLNCQLNTDEHMLDLACPSLRDVTIADYASNACRLLFPKSPFVKAAPKLKHVTVYAGSSCALLGRRLRPTLDLAGLPSTITTLRTIGATVLSSDKTVNLPNLTRWQTVDTVFASKRGLSFAYGSLVMAAPQFNRLVAQDFEGSNFCNTFRSMPSLQRSPLTAWPLTELSLGSRSKFSHVEVDPNSLPRTIVTLNLSNLILHCTVETTFPALVRVSFSSVVFKPGPDGRKAMKMPKLRDLEIWDGDGGTMAKEVFNKGPWTLIDGAAGVWSLTLQSNMDFSSLWIPKNVTHLHLEDIKFIGELEGKMKRDLPYLLTASGVRITVRHQLASVCRVPSAAIVAGLHTRVEDMNPNLMNSASMSQCSLLW